MSAKSESAERDKWLRDAIELSPDATIIVNESGIISRVNKRAEELFGYPRDEMIDLAVEMLVPEEFRAGHPAHRNTFANSASVRQMSSSLKLMAQKKSGELFPVNISLSPLDNLGEGRQVLASVRDNTELHTALAVAEAHVNELRNISDTANDAIITINANSEILSWNAAASRIFGHATKDAIGQHLSLIIPEHLQQSHFEGVAHISGGGDSKIIGKTVEVEGLRKSGEIFPVEMSLATWVGESDRIFGGILRDITERKRAEEGLAEAKDAADAANQTKSAFLANMSHELRTPMNAILGYAEMLAEEAEESGDEDQLADINEISDAGEHLLSLLNDVLDISKIEAGRMALYLETFDLTKMMGEVASTTKTLVEKNHNAMEVSISEDLGEMHADVTKVRQVLFNLMSNAAKFTSEGTITLFGERRAKSGGEIIRLGVSDTGIGIPEDKLDHVFEEFAQADEATTKNFGGTGLGLALVKRFCEMMGGWVWVESTMGEGSSFILELPATVVEQEE